MLNKENFNDEQERATLQYNAKQNKTKVRMKVVLYADNFGKSVATWIEIDNPRVREALQLASQKSWAKTNHSSLMVVLDPSACSHTTSIPHCVIVAMSLNLS